MSEDLDRNLVLELTRKLDKLCLAIETVKDRQD